MQQKWNLCYWLITKSNAVNSMDSGHMWVTKGQKNYPETDESGQFWRSTMVDMDSRLRVASGIAKTETDASVLVFETLKKQGHPDTPTHNI